MVFFPAENDDDDQRQGEGRVVGPFGGLENTTHGKIRSMREREIRSAWGVRG